MSRLPFAAVAFTLFIGVFLLVNIAFVVPETHSALVFRFGEPKNQYMDAGLKFKLPFAETVQFIDKRNLELEQEETEIVSRNQDRLLVDAFARYKIVDPLLFYQSVRSIEGGERRLRNLLDSDVRQVLGGVTVDEIISTRRADLMRRIQQSLTVAAREIGVEIVDVKIRKADLPLTNSQAVFNRMIAERNQLAQQFRSQGTERANQRRAEAERRAIEIKATAEEEAQRIRGSADATRNCIFGGAYDGVPVEIKETFVDENPLANDPAQTQLPDAESNQADNTPVIETPKRRVVTCKFLPGGKRDPQRAEFFAFYRSLLAYEESLRKGETTILLSPDSEFFRYFNDLQGKRN